MHSSDMCCKVIFFLWCKMCMYKVKLHNVTGISRLFTEFDLTVVNQNEMTSNDYNPLRLFNFSSGVKIDQGK